jgi:hypothetical protein
VQPATGNTPAPPARRQLLGLRPGPVPYYHIAERGAGWLVLRSHPRANARAGYGIIARGAVYMAIAVFIFAAGSIGAAQAGGGFGSAAITAVISAVLAALGFNRLVGGVAVMTTTNEIMFDAGARSITYTQANRVSRERTQQLRFDQIAGLRLRPRTLVRSGAVGRRQPIITLDLITGRGESWLIDSAAQAEALAETAAAVSEVLGLQVERVAD